jgi:hypothetical protein
MASQDVGGVISSFFGGGGGGPGSGLAAPLNFIHNLQPNKPLSSAIQETLSKVFPSAEIRMRISPLLKLAYQDAGMYQNFTQYASFIKNLSHSILGIKGYAGINFLAIGNKITVTDFTQKGGVTQISVLDLIGQPTWINQNQCEITCVLRGDLQPDDIIQLPQNIMYAIGQGGGAIAGNPDQRNQLSFSGTFRIVQMHHTGDFRNPDGVQWSTHYTCNVESWGETPSFGATPDITVGQTQQEQQLAQQLADGVIPLSMPMPSRLLQRRARRYG